MKRVFSLVLCILALSLPAQSPGFCMRAVLTDYLPFMPTGPRSIASGDFNGDGFVDLAVIKANSPEINVTLGNGTGIYGFGTAYTQTVGMSQIVAGDFNNDGKLDLATANGSDNSVSVYTGLGNGAFNAALTHTAGPGVASLASADFNGDGKLDLVTANTGSNTVSVLLGNGSGGFSGVTVSTMTVPPSPNCTIIPGRIVCADFNNDSKMDVAVTSGNVFSGYCNVLFVLLGNGTGALTQNGQFSTPLSPFDMVAADFNQDGKADLAYVCTTSNSSPGPLVISYGNGTGSFSSSNSISADPNPVTLMAGDFDGNTTIDLGVVNQYNNQVTLYRNAGGAFSATNTVKYPVFDQPSVMVLVDVNNDTKKDLVVAGQSSSSLNTLINYGNSWFGAPRLIDAPVSGKPVMADFNNDGTTDAAGLFAGSVSVLFGAAAGTPAVQTQTLNIAMSVGTGGDFNSDGNADLAVVDVNQYVRLLLGTGTGSFNLAPQFNTLAAMPGNIITGNFNGDNKTDLAVFTGSTITVLLNNGSASFSTFGPFTTGSALYSIASGDFNTDNFDDLVVSRNGSAQTSILLSLGNGNFSPAVTYTATTGTNPGLVDVITGHFNNDNIADLAVLSYAGWIYVYTGSASGALSTPTVYTAASGAMHIDRGDFNGDGKEDLATTSIYHNKITLFAGNGDGTFGSAVIYEAGQTPGAFSAGDINADAKTDLVINMGPGWGLLMNGSSSGIVSVAASTNNACPGTSVSLVATGAITFDWSTGATTPFIVVSPTATTVYTLTAFNANACGGTQLISVDVLPGTDVSLSALPSTVCVNSPMLSLQASPSGGSFSGPGVLGNNYTPTTLGENLLQYAYTYTNNCVLTATAGVFVDACTSAGTVTGDNAKLMVYPNPAGDHFTVSAGAAFTVRAFNALGIEVLNAASLEAENVVSTASWSNGVYTISISTQYKSQNIKLIKH